MGRTLLVDFLCVLFGIGTWVSINGVWVELPLLVASQPEAWRLPSFMSVVIQIANVGPLSYSILHSLYPRRVTERPAIYLTMAIGCAASICLALFWDRTTHIFGEERSSVLLGLLFCLALVDCSSRVLYLPFMASFKEIYLTSFFIGEGLSGFLPSVFALIQGVGGNPRCENVTIINGTEENFEIQAVYTSPVFSVDIFFYLLLTIMVVSAVSFQLLNQKSLVGDALVPALGPNPQIVLLGGRGSQQIPSYQSTSPEMSRHAFGLMGSGAVTDDAISDDGSESNVKIISNGANSNDKFNERPAMKDSFLNQMSPAVFFYLLSIQALVCCFANGILSSIQSYSCLPYGNVAYHWAVTLSSMANPAVCFLAFFIPPPSKFSISNVCLLGFVAAGYVITTAIMSPIPPLVGSAVGEILLVLAWILLSGFFTYVKISVATILRSEGKRGLFWCGAVTQLGSAVGAVFIFFIVNYTQVFQSYQACQG